MSDRTKITIEFKGGVVREYSLADEVEAGLDNGKHCAFIFCHPDTGDIANAYVVECLPEQNDGG